MIQINVVICNPTLPETLRECYPRPS